MADNQELDKTIEELEAEVLGELEESSELNEMDTAPMKKGAMASEKQEAVPSDGATGKADVGGGKPEGKVQKDATKAVNDPADAIGKKASAQAKEVSGDAQQKGEGAPDKMDTPNDGMSKVAKPLAAGDENIEGDEVLSEMEKMEMMKKEMAKMTKAEMKDKMEMMMKEMAKKMEMMKKDEMTNLMAQFQKMEMMKKEEQSEEQKAKIEARVKDIDVKEHVDALMDSESSELSEEFKRKAATVFEAAVKSKVREEVTRLEEEYANELTSEINETKEDLSEKVDNYLNYVVEEWMKENTLAVERGLKGEIAEDFISGLKQLFEDHYVDVPDEKYDVLEAQSEKISKLEEKLDDTIAKLVEEKKSTASLVREKVISESVTDLAETEIEKFQSLVKEVDFTDEESFKEKIATLKESYFPRTKVEKTETIDDVETGPVKDIDVSDSMSVYMSAIGRSVKSANTNN